MVFVHIYQETGGRSALGITLVVNMDVCWMT